MILLLQLRLVTNHEYSVSSALPSLSDDLVITEMCDILSNIDKPIQCANIMVISIDIIGDWYN